MPEDAIELAIKALRQKMTATEERISELEDELQDLRAERTKTDRGLVALDPTWRADKPKRQASKGSQWRRADGAYPVSKGKVEAVVEWLRKNDDGTTFSAGTIPLDEIGMSNATRNAALNELARRGNLRIDRATGQGGARFYAVTRLPDE